MCVWGNMSGETYIPRNSRYVCMYVQGMYIWGNIHTLCLGKHTYLETRGMYVCQRYVYLGKHTYLENDRYVCMSPETYIPRNYRYVCMYPVCMYVCRYVCMYVCMSGETYIPSKLQVCMVCMYVWVHVQHRRVCGQRVQVVFMYVKGMYIWGHIHTYIHTYKPIFQVCMFPTFVSPDIHKYLSFSRSVCFLHTSFAEVSKYLAGNPIKVCMYVCMSKHTDVATMGMYVCLGKHTPTYPI